MASIAELKRKRAELDKEIQQMEAAEKAKKASQDIRNKYVQVACPNCDGYGTVGVSSLVDNSDIDERDCEDCGGKGFLLGRKWEGRRRHDFEHNQITSAN